MLVNVTVTCPVCGEEFETEVEVEAPEPRHNTG